MKAKVEAIRSYLINEKGVDEDLVNSTKGKRRLVDLLDQEDIKRLDNMEEEKTNKREESEDNNHESGEILWEEDEKKEVVAKTPEQVDVSRSLKDLYNSVDWYDYVLSEFDLSELDNNGYPKVEGLRRVVEKLLGTITFTGPVTTSVNAEDGYSVVWEIRIDWSMDVPGYVSLENYTFPQKVVRAFAGASSKNTSHPYSKYLESIADTRAEAKCLRRLLRLRTVASEEVDDEEVKTEESAELATRLITIMCSRMSIDVEKFLEREFPGKTLNSLNSEQAKILLKTLNLYQTNMRESKDIPEEIKL